MIQGVLFDMDGVLFDTERLSIGCSDEVAAEWGFEIPANLAEEICGSNYQHYRDLMLAHMGEDFDFERYYKEGHDRFYAKLEAMGMPKMKGVDSTLEWLRANGYRIAIASSTKLEMIKTYIDRAGIAHYFDAIMAGDMVENSKPAPEIFEKAAAALDLRPADCVAVEDSVNGVKSASSAGCATVMIPDLMAATPELRALCTAVLGSLEELPELIRFLNDETPKTL